MRIVRIDLVRRVGSVRIIWKKVLGEDYNRRGERYRRGCENSEVENTWRVWGISGVG